MLTDIDDKIIAAMARTLHVTAYIDGVENKTIRGRKARAGEDWMDVAPKTRKEAVAAAHVLAGRIIELNKDKGHSLFIICRAAAQADINEQPVATGTEATIDEIMDDKYLFEFGHCLAMESLGEGVGWTDDHALEIETPLIEFSY
jgi:hypothetical protein